MAFKITEDAYYRGNGRWAKVVRQHELVGDKWKISYSVAYGIEGDMVATSVEYFSRRFIAVFHAKEYIKTGTIPV